MKKLDTDNFAIDLLAAARDIAKDSAGMTSLLQSLFSGPESDSEMMGLIRAVIRIRNLEVAILQSLASFQQLGPIGGADVYRDLSRAVVMAAMAHSEESVARLRTFYPHLLSEADIETIRLTVKTGMNRQDLGRAVEYLQEVQERLDSKINT